MIQKIRKDIYAIPVPLPDNPLKELNAYLIKGKDRSLLIDTGFCLPVCREALEEGLTQAGADRAHLDVLGTHLHSDHIGLAADFVSPGHCVYLGKLDYLFTQSAFEAAYWRKTDQRFLQEGFPWEELQEVMHTSPARLLGPPKDLPCYRPVEEGHVFSVGDYRLEVLWMPGHTPGQICLWIPQEGILFAADHVLFDITPNIAMWPNLENALGHYLDSLRRIRTYPVKLALPGHRHSGDFIPRVDALLLHHKNRVAETLSIVTKYPGLTAYDITGRMTWDIRAKSWDDFPLNQKWFAVGEALAHLELLVSEGRVLRQMGPQGLAVYFPADTPVR